MNLKVKEMTLVSLFTALTAIGAMISIPIGPAPITLQTIFVLLSGIILGPKLGALSQTIYVLLGLLGLPIFAGFKGGLQVIYSPTFGYLIGFIIASYIIGKIIYSNGGFSRTKIFIACTMGTFVISLLGVSYMYYILNVVMGTPSSIGQVAMSGFLLFLPGDILKMIISSVIAIKLIPVLQ